MFISCFLFSQQPPALQVFLTKHWRSHPAGVCPHPLLCERAHVPNLSPDQPGLTLITAPDVNVTSLSSNEIEEKLNLRSGLRWGISTPSHPRVDRLTVHTHQHVVSNASLVLECAQLVIAVEPVSFWSLKSFKCLKMTGNAVFIQWIQLQLIQLHLIMWFKVFLLGFFFVCQKVNNISQTMLERLPWTRIVYFVSLHQIFFGSESSCRR